MRLKRLFILDLCLVFFWFILIYMTWKTLPAFLTSSLFITGMIVWSYKRRVMEGLTNDLVNWIFLLGSTYILMIFVPSQWPILGFLMYGLGFFLLSRRYQTEPLRNSLFLSISSLVATNFFGVLIIYSLFQSIVITGRGISKTIESLLSFISYPIFQLIYWMMDLFTADSEVSPRNIVINGDPNSFNLLGSRAETDILVFYGVMLLIGIAILVYIILRSNRKEIGKDESTITNQPYKSEKITEKTPENIVRAFSSSAYRRTYRRLERKLARKGYQRPDHIPIREWAKTMPKIKEELTLLLSIYEKSRYHEQKIDKVDHQQFRDSYHSIIKKLQE
ncbi:DUF4129 domain-containing protein [Salipaludibacillus aurantiacus]|uniref:Protein-glutamine gamma-glutamyltransferase-like C-terminal domain-containing protein n=1 Tax=Salipaludibacillus aurantiacus TaxID=1601833 RepID=A0A1H9USD5_9BACI|nr:DUF4129 domain-containing protein [Salipaludibacillus aurantiacus]SES12251.1 protein of unknown function [Salipaludibacillus aurantiacus]